MQSMLAASTNRIILLAALFASSTTMTSCEKGGVIASDDFEQAELSASWDVRKFVPGAVQMQSDVVRTGERAALITLHPGDQIPAEKGTRLERAELQEPSSVEALLNTNYEYAFSLRIPEDFPVSPTRLVIAQWKQRCLAASCTPDNPTIALRYESGQLFLTHQVAERREELYRQAADVRGQWLDFRTSLRFSHTQDGLIRMWINSTQVADYRGVNAYSTDGYSDRFYFKVGLYRDAMPVPMSIFLDDYRKALR